MASVTFGRRSARPPRPPRPRPVRSHAALVAAGVLPTYEMTQGSFADHAFTDLAGQAGFTDFGFQNWPCESTEIVGAADALLREGSHALFRLGDGSLALFQLGFGFARLRVAASSELAVAGACAAFAALYPCTYLELTDDRVPITFWTLSPHGPVNRLRMIDAQPWAAIEANYPEEVRAPLAGLMGDFVPGATGQLLLWQGPPGTGKTWALRALASEWRDWAEFHYITDPDAFFVESPSYMVDVLLADTYPSLAVVADDVLLLAEEAPPEGKWRILILEDTGELLSANAKEKYGQGLSRLLNVVDGMIGQGLRVLCLVTTNDELGELNAAVRRPGRCASQIEFRGMSSAEVAAWLDVADSGDLDGLTLAEMYARRGAGQPALEPEADEPEAESLVAATVPPRAHYRPAEDAKQSCATCEYFNAGRCSMWHAVVEPDYTCDSWEAAAASEATVDLDEVLRLASAPLGAPAPADALPDALAASSPMRVLLEVHRQTLAAAARIVEAELGERGERVLAGQTAEIAARAISALESVTGGLALVAARQPADVHVHVPEAPAPTVTAPVVVNVPEQKPAQVFIDMPEPAAPVAPNVQVDVHVPEAAPQPAPHVDVHVPALAAAAPPAVIVNVEQPPAARPHAVRIEYDDSGNRRFVLEEEESE